MPPTRVPQPAAMLAFLLAAASTARADVPFFGVVIEAETSVPAHAPAAGRVVSLEAGVGADVKEGQVLARLDIGGQETRGDDTPLAEAEASAAAAIVRLESAKKDYDRARQLREAMLISNAEFDAIESAYKLAQADDASAKRKLESARKGKRQAGAGAPQAAIASPIAGTVIERAVSVGEAVAPGGPDAPFRVTPDPTRMKLTLRLDRESAAKVSVGQKAWLRTSGQRSRVFNGTVSRVEDAEAVVSVENPERLLWPGLDVDGAVTTEGAALAAPALTAEQKAFGDNDAAVVIGIERYPDLPPSEFSGSDAQLVAKYLLALGIRQANLQLLTDAKASYGGIRKTIESWLPGRIKKGSRVFVYYSGHGAPDPASGDAYMVPSDGDPNYLSDTGYPLKRLYEKLGNLPASEVMVVLDSCYSGAGFRSLLAKGARPLVTMAAPANLAPSLAVLTATKAGQISTSSPERRHGLMTYHFLKALSDGKRSLAEAFAYVRPAVEDEAKALNAEQTPELTPSPAEGRFLLRK
ncbi:MAG: caspase family protein [Elusimicrobia bacterium]|nr:caspase family protein [Elusimicrobiota bacterium]